MTAVAAAEQAKLDIDESSRLAGGKVKVIGESHNAAWVLITCNACNPASLLACGCMLEEASLPS